MAGYEQPCQVTGTVRAGGRERAIAALGQRGRAWGDPDWERIELARTVGAWTDAACAALTAVRPAGASNHAEEAAWAAYWEPEGPCSRSTTAALSTTYDGEGRDAPRRARAVAAPTRSPGRAARAGEVLCGSSLDLGALRLDCAFFRWHLEGRHGRRPLRHPAPRRRRVIRAVVSDFGGVLTSPLLEGFARVQAGHGRAAARVRRGAGARGRRRTRCSRSRSGAITEAEFLAALERELAAILGRDGLAARLRGALHGRAGRQRRAVRLLPRRSTGAASGFALCTNNVREWEPLWRAKLPIDEIFETVVDSAFVGVRKPEPEIYAIVLERLGLAGGRVRVRRRHRSATSRPRAALGFAGVHFRDTAQAIAELDALLDGAG